MKRKRFSGERSNREDVSIRKQHCDVKFNIKKFKLTLMFGAKRSRRTCFNKSIHTEIHCMRSFCTGSTSLNIEDWEKNNK